jgi:thiol-disulfide isomerase/thioredoxin
MGTDLHLHCRNYEDHGNCARICRLNTKIRDTGDLMLARLTLALLFITGISFAQQPDDVFVGQPAPEIKKSDVWINSAPLTLASLKGKVVVIDFWAFDCPYCAEAMPHIQDLYAKYAKNGLVVIGVHTPRIDYEKDIPKIKEAVTKKGIKFPVVVDNKFDIWSDYLCSTWPSQFVVDREGIIQFSHSGTGRYDEMEKVVQKLLNKK